DHQRGEQHRARSGSHVAGLGAGGGMSNATIGDWNPHVWCAESQNGLLPDWPQRQSETRGRPARPNGLPSWSTSSNSPSTLSEPLLITVILVAAIHPPLSALFRGGWDSSSGFRDRRGRRVGPLSRWSLPVPATPHPPGA